MSILRQIRAFFRWIFRRDINVAKAPFFADTTGEKDAGDAINQAIQKAGWWRNGVYLPAGTYKIKTPLNFSAGITIRGAGPDKTIFEA